MSRSRSAVVAVAIVAGASALASAALAAKPHPKAPALKAGTYTGTVTMAPVYQGPGSSIEITLSGTWTLKVDRQGHLTGTESLAGTMPITPSGGCSASPDSYTLRFTATFGRTQVGFAITGAPGFVQGKVVVVDVDSNQSGLGWSATPSTYQLTCGALPPGTDDILFFGELGVPIVTYAIHLPLAMFTNVGHPYSVKVENVENTPFTQVYTLAKGPK